MSWSFVDNRNIFLKLKSRIGLYHVVLTTPRTSPEKLTLTVVKMQQLPDIDNTYSKEEVSCQRRTLYNVRRKLCVNFQTDTDKLNFVVCGYRTSSYLKDNEVNLKTTEYQSLLTKRV